MTDQDDPCPSCGEPLGAIDGCRLETRVVRTDTGRTVGVFEIGWCRHIGDWDRRVS